MIPEIRRTAIAPRVPLMIAVVSVDCTGAIGGAAVSVDCTVSVGGSEDKHATKRNSYTYSW